MKTEFDYTMMSTFQQCQRRYDLRINRGIVGKAPIVAADFGKGIHAALDSWYKDKDVKHAIEVFKATFKEAEGDKLRTYKMAEWILRNYHDKYQDQPFEILATEQEFTTPLPNGSKLIGRIDKIIRWDGVVWGVDHKTTSALGDTYMRMHSPNLQFSGYTWAIRQMGFDGCQGILVDAILVAKGLVEGRASSLTPLRRDFAYRTDADIAEYLQTVECLQKEIWVKELAEDGRAWTPNWGSCTDYGECPYRQICKEPPQFREAIIRSEYTVDMWDPRHKEAK